MSLEAAFLGIYVALWGILGIMRIKRIMGIMGIMGIAANRRPITAARMPPLALTQI